MMDWICPAILNPRSWHVQKSSQSAHRVWWLPNPMSVHSARPGPGRAGSFLSVVSAVLVSQGQQLMYAVMIHRLCYMPSTRCGYTGYNVVMRCTHAHSHTKCSRLWFGHAVMTLSSQSLSPSQCSMLFVLVRGPRKHDMCLSVVSHTRRGISTQDLTASFDRMQD